MYCSLCSAPSILTSFRHTDTALCQVNFSHSYLCCMWLLEITVPKVNQKVWSRVKGGFAAFGETPYVSQASLKLEILLQPPRCWNRSLCHHACPVLGFRLLTELSHCRISAVVALSNNLAQSPDLQHVTRYWNSHHPSTCKKIFPVSLISSQLICIMIQGCLSPEFLWPWDIMTTMFCHTAEPLTVLHIQIPAILVK